MVLLYYEMESTLKITREKGKIQVKLFNYTKIKASFE